MGDTKIRKAESNVDQMGIIQDYIEGTMTVSEIAQKYNTTGDNVGLIANRHWKALTNMRESRLLPQTELQGPVSFEAKRALRELHNTELINEDFLSKLSDCSASLLTDEEATFSWTYVHTGDLHLAMADSGLDIGLYKEKGKITRFSHDRAITLRGQYLLAKPNIVSYIKELRESRLIDSDVGKARVQSELITQIEQMKASGDTRNRMAMMRAIELLGKTVGAFVDRVEIREINPGDALDHLIEMAKEAQVTPVDSGKTLEIPQ